jgi:F-type H+-transporting ATPase subunit b
MEIIQQVGALFVGAIPTALLFIVLVISYQLLIQGPLTKTLQERRARTAGAVEDAQKAIAEAELRAADYAARLHEARVEIYKLREQRVKQWNTERDAALELARKAAHGKVGQAIVQIEAEASAARLSIQGAAGELANQVVRAILPLAAGGSR